MLAPLLAKSISPLVPHLAAKGLVELIINKPGEVCLETVGENGRRWETINDPLLTLKTLKAMAGILATESGQVFSDNVPILACHLPQYGYRVQIVSGSAIQGGFGMAIRVGAALTFPITNWMPEDEAAALIEAVKIGKTVLVCGGTGSGKTTLTNSLIQHIPIETRVITIEDALELNLPHTNCMRLVKSKTGTDMGGVTYEDFINMCMRLRPDRILVGELDINNTVAFLRVANSGHSGCMTTVHADSPKLAIKAIVQNGLMKGYANADVIEDFAIQCIDYIVHVKRENNTFSASMVSAK